MMEPMRAVTPDALKMRLCHPLSFPVPASAENGIEKVRGSTPLISTNGKCVQNKGFRDFWPSRRPGLAVCWRRFTTLYNTRRAETKGQRTQ